MTDPSKFMKNFEKFLKEPTDEELNKRLHEIMGLCWHEHKPNIFDPIRLSVDYGCIKCGKGFIYSYNNLLTWEGFGVLWEWLQKHEEWEKFMEKWGIPGHYREWLINTELINSRALAEAVVRFFKENKP